MFVLEKFSDEEEKVTFYTVREPEDCELSQTEDFFIRIPKTDYKDEFYDLIEFIFTSIGNKLGAQECWFNRLEKEATALPPKKQGKAIGQAKINEINFQIFNSKIRLYCLRLSDSVVILFNGGIKLTKGPAHKDSGVSMHFHDAHRYSLKIIEALRDNDICIKYKSIVGLDGKNDKILIEL